VDRAHLGDRIRVNRIEVERGLVGLDLTVHGPRDGACCPTERSTMYYALQSEQLVKVSTPAQNTPSLIEGRSGHGNIPSASMEPEPHRPSRGTIPCVSGPTGNSMSGLTATGPEDTINWTVRA
jgi:hypothetical protein